MERGDEEGANTPERLAIKVLQQAAADGNAARVCRRFGISRKSFYRFEEAARRARRCGSVIGRGSRKLCRRLLMFDTHNVTWTFESFVAWAGRTS